MKDTRRTDIPAGKAHDELRAKFEDWIRRQSWFKATLGICRRRDDYSDPCINSRWQGWQACHAAMQGEDVVRDAERYRALRIESRKEIDAAMGERHG